MTNSPVCFGSVPRVHQIFNGQLVQILVLSQGRNDIPAQTVDIDPATFGP